MQEEIALGERCCAIRPIPDNLQFWKTGPKDFFHAAVHAAGPERDLRIGAMFLQQRQHSRCVCNVTDVHRLPGRPKQYPRCKASGENFFPVPLVNSQEFRASLNSCESSYGRFVSAARLSVRSARRSDAFRVDTSGTVIAERRKSRRFMVQFIAAALPDGVRVTVRLSLPDCIAIARTSGDGNRSL